SSFETIKINILSQRPQPRRLPQQRFSTTGAHGISDGQFRIIPARRERPHCRCATDERYELATAAHSITSSRRARDVGGTSMPSALAVGRLMTNSNLVGCWTGKSLGLSPLRMRST